jgi:hypothetical protein
MQDQEVMEEKETQHIYVVIGILSAHQNRRKDVMVNCVRGGGER